ncbi:arginine N-succinyltransferase [Marinobacterium sp. D7]|uniref:arginine N-succinyltransferase n=1 Tax=Marinobacterium ramblicola TaxID=2849041 RepID=UPI001C2DC664|nr:arginine N-succinyltransferase [Marinobacterium ramblicola]MBV1787050.1 arginine N-succinyltransferase [Marinobacterium ramblicola]
MMIIRPVHQDDWAALRELARKTGPGFTSMQDDDEHVRSMIEAGTRAFSAPPENRDAYYLFVMEESDSGQVVGTCAIHGAVGMKDVWYSYRLGTLVQASRELGVYRKLNTLTISNDQTGCSELCTLFLDPEYRRSLNGHLLSKSRFLFMAEFPHLFSDTLIAEMRGYSDDNGISPFWEGLGRQFFSIDFTQADQLSTRNKVFIAELMPKHPIYTNLLPQSAQDAIGQTQEATKPARRLLESEGMRYNNYVDIFDAGPMLEAPMQDIRAIRDSLYFKARIDDEIADQEQPFLISNTLLEGFRCCTSRALSLRSSIASLNSETAAALNVRSGDTLRIVPLFAERRA